MRLHIWITILGMAVATYLTRAPLLLLLSRRPLPPRLRLWLGLVPLAVLPALAIPMVLVHDGRVAASLCDALDSAGPYGAGWPTPRVAAGPARLLKTSIVGDGHVRGIACGDDGKSFKWIAFRSASSDLGQSLLASPADKRWWLAGTIKRDEWNGGNAAEMHLEDAAPA